MRIVFVALTIFILCISSVLAQRSASPGGLGRAEQPANNRINGLPGVRMEPDIANRTKIEGMNGLSTFQFSADVINVHPQENSIEIRRKSNKSEHTFALASDCKIKADEKQFGKKELGLDEIEPGYRVEVLLDLRSNQITQMRVKKPKS